MGGSVVRLCGTPASASLFIGLNKNSVSAKLCLCTTLSQRELCLSKSANDTRSPQEVSLSGVNFERLDLLNLPAELDDRSINVRQTSRTSALLILSTLFFSSLSLTTPGFADELKGFTRGDCNGDTLWDLSDPIGLIHYLLIEGLSPRCSDGCDINDDGMLDISDGIYSLGGLFGVGAPPLAPYPECGHDETVDSLRCELPPCPLAEISTLRSFTAPTGRVESPYSAQLPTRVHSEIRLTNTGEVIVPEVRFVEWGISASSLLPPGLSLDQSTGRILGTPIETGAFTFLMWGRDEFDDFHSIRVDLAIFTINETEITSNQDFSAPGEFVVETLSDIFLHTHQLPWPPPYELWNCNPNPPPVPSLTQGKLVQIYHPVDASIPTPLVVFHHGAGFSHLNYDSLLSHLASYGFTVVSVSDFYSYSTYTSYYCWGGHLEGARVMKTVRDSLESAALDPAYPLHGEIDFSRVFYAGHSRGGASAILACELDPTASGAMALQPTDARGDSYLGNTNRWDLLPAIPLLIMTAEQDYDTVFPWAERLLERATGPTVMATIYGGCHGYSTDENSLGCLNCQWAPTTPLVDQCTYISRELQCRLTRQMLVAFLRRHGQLDLSVEGLLYGAEWQGSPYLAVSGIRNFSASTWVDDFSTFPIHQLGQSWMSTGIGSFGVGSCYDTPSPNNSPLVPIENLVIELLPSTSLTLFTHLSDSASNGSGLGIDVSTHQHLLFRMKNHDRWQLVDNFGFGWLSASIELIDADGEGAEVSLDDYLPQTEFHPETSGSQGAVILKAQRFINVRIPLSEFLASNPALQLNMLDTLQIQLETSSTPALMTTPVIGLDDLRFE